ncbi:hypothetical protein FA13DRAFT_430118 [Coprinellus micaceus]|uniref:Uncharacterized protein n=1 Tax=Coprinellus micaceus TaxID=71717 RepID=A0A4Y7TXY4_COPMI|nr:hypothetical protein FA13DRAFT_430118 [Coprinellus micaceus]
MRGRRGPLRVRHGWQSGCGKDHDRGLNSRAGLEPEPEVIVSWHTRLVHVCLACHSHTSRPALRCPGTATPLPPSNAVGASSSLSSTSSASSATRSASARSHPQLSLSGGKNPARLKGSTRSPLLLLLASDGDGAATTLGYSLRCGFSTCRCDFVRGSGCCSFARPATVSGAEPDRCRFDIVLAWGYRICSTQSARGGKRQEGKTYELRI